MRMNKPQSQSFFCQKAQSNFIYILPFLAPTKMIELQTEVLVAMVICIILQYYLVQIFGFWGTLQLGIQ